MTATVGTNSYVNVADADTYFSDKYGYTEWSAASVSDKNAALVSACQHLDLMCDWFGYPVSSSQNLAFPRTPDASPVPQAVKDAQCEIANNIIINASVSTDGGDAVEELKAGSVQLKFKARGTGNPLLNKLVERLLAPYGYCVGSGSTKTAAVWRA